MLELVLIYCMIGAPDRCIEQRVPMFGDSGIQCMIRGQTEASRYLATHPNWLLASWRCMASSAVQDPA
jgi:hypothetical protein